MTYLNTGDPHDLGAPDGERADCAHPRRSEILANGQNTGIVFCPDCRATLTPVETIIGRDYAAGRGEGVQ